MKIKKFTSFLMALACGGAISVNAIETDQIKLVNCFAEDAAGFENVSDNGEWAVGSLFDASDNRGWYAAASKWNLLTGERTFLASVEDGESRGKCVSNDGSIVGGSYLFQPAYNLNGKWNVLEMPEGYTMGEVNNMTIVGNDTIFVGYVQDGPDFQRLEAAKWVNGKYNNANNGLDRDRLGDPALSNCIYDISADGKTLLGGLNFNIWMGHVTTFVTRDTVSTVIKYDEFDKDLLVDECMIRFPYLSGNGKYFIGDFWHATLDPDFPEFATELEFPVVYDIENNRAQLVKSAEGCISSAIDDAGNPYFSSPSGMPVRNAFIYKNGQMIDIKDILLSNGVSQAELDKLVDPELKNLGTLIAVTPDGKTILMCGGPCHSYNWAMHLPKNIYEMETTPTPVISNDNLAVYYMGDVLFLSGMVDHIEVYSINGAMVMNEDVESAYVPANLEKGLYVVKLYNNESNTITTSKILVR